MGNKVPPARAQCRQRSNKVLNLNRIAGHSYSSAVTDEFLSSLCQRSIPKNITGTDMKGIIELPLTNNSVIPTIDNTQPVMINTSPVILVRFIV